MASKREKGGKRSPRKRNTSSTPGKRPTIGFFVDYAASAWGYQSLLWGSIADAVQAQGANLIVFSGGGLWPSPEENPTEYLHNTIYDLANGELLDGLIVLSNTLSAVVGREAFEAFLGRYRHLPTVSIGMQIKGVPSVTVENEKGLRDAITHLIEAHDYRHIAFIKGVEGNPDSEERYRVYTKVLAEHDIPLEPDLVTPGDFTAAGGMAAIRLLLDERKKRPGVSLEAVVAANDGMAIGAIDELQARSVRVPYDVAVIGFDDTADAGAITPPLTTVRQPIREMGKRAADMLFNLLSGEQAPEHVTLTTEMVVRQSCGCFFEPAVERAVKTRVRAKTLKGVLAALRETILSDMVQAVSTTRLDSKSAAALSVQLLDAFSASLAGKEAGSSFAATLDDVLRQTMAFADDVTAWFGAISALRRHLQPHLTDHETLSRAIDLWQQAWLAIGEAGKRIQMYRRVEAEQRHTGLRDVGDTLVSTFNMATLTDTAARLFPSLGITSCYISLYEQEGKPDSLSVKGKPGSTPERARLVMAYDENGRIELGKGKRFPSRHLIPEDMLSKEKPLHLQAEALHFTDDLFGFVVFAAQAGEGFTYTTLSRQTSTALKVALLLEEQRQAEEALAQAYTEVERQVQERTAELQREIAEREKAQDEALHLQMEVIEAQKRAIQELSTPIIPVLEGVIVMPLIGSVDSLRARDLTRRLLAGIREHRARVVILDITGVPLVDSGVAAHLNKTIQAARLKGARTIITGISDAVAETIVDLGIDWTGIDTLADLQTGLRVALGTLRGRTN